MKALILSDSRQGHVNQSIAFCKYRGLEYEIIKISFLSSILKLASYALDFLGLYIPIFSFQKHANKKYDVVVSAGSSTYYALKYFSKKYSTKSVAMMFPKGFRKNYDLFFTMKHDLKEKFKNSVILPVNVTCTEVKNYYTPKTKAISFIIGGSNKNLLFDSKKVLHKIQYIIKNFPNYEVLITTSPRTPKDFEQEIQQMECNFKVLYSQNPINPIGDFLLHSDFVFITEDSTSMISEAVCFSKAWVEVLELESKTAKPNKHKKFISILEKEGYLHIYKERCSEVQTKKFPLQSTIESIQL